MYDSTVVGLGQAIARKLNTNMCVHNLKLYHRNIAWAHVSDQRLPGCPQTPSPCLTNL